MLNERNSFGATALNEQSNYRAELSSAQFRSTVKLGSTLPLEHDGREHGPPLAKLAGLEQRGPVARDWLLACGWDVAGRLINRRCAIRIDDGFLAYSLRRYN